MMPPDLKTVHHRIEACQQCDRLRNYCKKIAQEKRRAYQNDTYWGKPISGWGDPQARIMIVGLAPAAHGANRTGRVLTGDRSGDWLYRALHKAGFANQPHSVHANDGLVLRDTYISCVVKCAPPDNKPTRDEQEHCISFLEEELKALPNIQIWIALGQIALNGLWPLLPSSSRPSSRPRFQHGAKIDLGDQRWLLLSYHPSQQNTFTGRLTEPMFDSVFSEAKRILMTSPASEDGARSLKSGT